MKLFLVWNHKAEEGYITANKEDAYYAAQGIVPTAQFGVSTIADSWKEIYTDDEGEYEVKEIDMPLTTIHRGS